MEKRLLISTLMGVCLLSGGLVLASDDPICTPVTTGDPADQVVGSTKDPRCALADDFTRSCAYRDFLRNEQRDALEAGKKSWVDRMGRVFDPTAEFAPKESLYRDIQTAVSDPKFFEIYRDWNLFSKPGRVTGMKPDFLGRLYSRAELEKFFKAMEALPLIDPSQMLTSGIELLSVLPKDEGAKSTLTERKKLLENIYSKGVAYRESHSVGCEKFIAKTHELNVGYTPFGPVLKKGDRDGSYGEEKEKAMAASQSIAGDRRNVAGMTEKLFACGNGSADIRKTVGLVQRSCDVDLPVKIFEDNQPRLASAEEQTLVAAIAKNDCYQKALKDGLKIEKIAIATSANTLHNTKNYCKWEFDRLSADRGKSIQAALGGFFTDPAVKYSISDRGSNGDGSSGPCAYVAKEQKGPGPSVFEVDDLVNGKKRTRYFSEERSPSYAGTGGERKLEPYKYARATIYFEDRTTPLQSDVRQWSAVTRCRELRFDCR